MEARERMPKLRTAMAIMVSTSVNPFCLRKVRFLFISDSLFLPSRGTGDIGVFPDSARSTHDRDGTRRGFLVVHADKYGAIKDVNAGVISKLTSGSKLHERW